MSKALAFAKLKAERARRLVQENTENDVDNMTKKSVLEAYRSHRKGIFVNMSDEETPIWRAFIVSVTGAAQAQLPLYKKRIPSLVELELAKSNALANGLKGIVNQYADEGKLSKESHKSLLGTIQGNLLNGSIINKQREIEAAIQRQEIEAVEDEGIEEDEGGNLVEQAYKAALEQADQLENLVGDRPSIMKRIFLDVKMEPEEDRWLFGNDEDKKRIMEGKESLTVEEKLQILEDRNEFIQSVLRRRAVKATDEEAVDIKDLIEKTSLEPEKKTKVSKFISDAAGEGKDEKEDDGEDKLRAELESLEEQKKSTENEEEQKILRKKIRKVKSKLDKILNGV